ncbi:M50 family metallopeptidase, partial [Mycobacterium sp.]|uniref:M50 family metallopeptidase n=1 Tax=Mycobacterium sp. TaxID=1785 RepID=UPI003F805944
MMFVIGIVLFALAILISVALHECGHMWVARATGMKVRRYFVGFGPTLWSTRRGETEYGLKAVPLGGFCDIAGMTSVEELAPDETERAMFKQAVWKRVAVLFAGPAANFIICLVLLYGVALIWGLPNLHPPTRAVVGETACVAPEVAPGKIAGCTGPGPAALAGIRPGDVIVKVGDTPVSTFEDMAAAIRKMHGNVPIVAERNGTRITTYVDVTSTQRYLTAGTNGQGGQQQPSTVGAIGVGAVKVAPTRYGVFTAIPATVAFAGDLTAEVGKALVAIPTKVGALVHAIGGGQRDPQTPMS